MNELNAECLCELVTSALERTAMVLAEPAITERATAAATRFARIHYEGTSRGVLTLGADDAFLRELASGLMGTEPTQVNVEVEGCDALKELANIIGGSVIVAKSEGACRSSLGLPELLVEGQAHGAGSAPAPSCTVTVDAGVLYVWLLEDVPLSNAA